MTLLSVNLPSGEVVSTCPAAVGFSFAAGTTDRPRGFDLTQGDSQVHDITSIHTRDVYPGVSSNVNFFLALILTFVSKTC